MFNQTQTWRQEGKCSRLTEFGLAVRASEQDLGKENKRGGAAELVKSTSAK